MKGTNQINDRDVPHILEAIEYTFGTLLESEA
jgi:hypothetical protein